MEKESGKGKGHPTSTTKALKGSRDIVLIFL